MIVRVRNKKLIERFLILKNQYGFKTNTSFLSLLLTCLEENERLSKEIEIERTKKSLTN